ESTQGRTQEGSGIGLALVQELVRLHGGRIEVTSQVNQGSTFRVLVPLGCAHLPAARIKAACSLVSTASGARAYVDEVFGWLPQWGEAEGTPAITGMVPRTRNTGPVPAAGARIVLADDNADMRSYLTTLLAPLYCVRAVSDGEQALASIQREPPD